MSTSLVSITNLIFILAKYANYNFDMPPLCSLTHLVLAGERALSTVAFFTWTAALEKMVFFFFNE
jgi:hypothetical protein